FTFTSIPRSYAAQTGRPAHVGVVGVALFRERTRPVPPPPTARQAPVAPPSTLSESPTRRSGAAQAGAAEAESVADASSADLAARTQAPGLGTGHGRREHSAARQVAFERARDVPDEVIRIRYDSRPNLVALGVLPRPQSPQPRRVDPFPDTRLGYVPDP